VSRTTCPDNVGQPVRTTGQDTPPLGGCLSERPSVSEKEEPMPATSSVGTQREDSDSCGAISQSLPQTCSFMSPTWRAPTARAISRSALGCNSQSTLAIAADAHERQEDEDG
jgi:hypothetical protein